MSTLVMLGAGGHARVVLAACNGAVTGCITPAAPDTLWPATIPWLGGDAALDELDPQAVRLVNGIGSIGRPDLRHRVFEAARTRGFGFAPAIHPAAYVSPEATPGPDSQIMAGAVLQTGVRLGENCIVNSGAVIDHDCVIGDHSHIAPGVTLSGGVTLGAGCHIGTGATVIQGITIGAGAVIAAGAVVIRDVAAGDTVGGVPARPLGTDRTGPKP